MLPISYKIIALPSAEPITLTDAKDYLNVDFSSKDTLISRLITDARRYAENMLHKSLVTQTIQLIYEPDPVAQGELSGPIGMRFDEDLWERPNVPLLGTARIVIPCLMGPVQTFTSLEYQLTRMDNPEWTLVSETDSGGNANYRLDSYADPNEVNVFTILAASRYRLTYVAGSDAMDPKILDLRTPLFSLINFWYEHREGDAVPDGIRQQFAERRVFML
ncbi:phage gp6-like head-tail connector protein [Ktedonobacteria bacterium brp13]|nr:phage gp6-like head-tail connector protein [Ktedonobacteria bacterium brp13]